MADQTIKHIAEFAAGAKYDSLPADVIATARRSLVDALGCAAGAYNSAEAQIARRVSPAVQTTLGELTGRVIGSPTATAPEFAAFANSCMIRKLDFNDHYPHLHPSDMIGALLAVVEMGSGDARDLISSIVVAYEVCTRMSDLGNPGNLWDQGYAAGVGTVAGLGNLLGISVDVLAEALSIIGTANVHLRSTRAGDLSMWKGAATAYSSYNAMFVLRLALAGMTGPESPIEGRHGLWEQVSGPFELNLPDAGGEYNIRKVSLKYWPTAFSAQSAVWAGQRLGQEIEPKELESVRLGMHRHGWHDLGSEPSSWDPRSRERADHSVPYIFAWAMLHGGIDLSAFEPKNYLDPDLRPLMAKIAIEPDDDCDVVSPKNIMLKVDAHSNDGRTLSFAIKNPKGFRTNAMTESEVMDKFVNQAEPLYGRSRAEEIYAVWSRFDEFQDVSRAVALLSDRD